MSKLVNSVVEIGSFGLIDDVTGVEGAEKASREAAGIQSDAALAGVEESRRQFDVTEESLAPFREAGIAGLKEQQALLGLSGADAERDALSRFTESPGQAFRRERAQKNLVRNSSAIGGLGGGNVRKALVEQGAGFAAQDFDTRFNRLGNQSSQGQQATTNIAQFGADASRSAQQGIQSSAEARASGILGGQQATAQSNQGLFQLGSTALLASDQKLKKNIKPSGKVNGFNWYSWSWNELANAIGLTGDSKGVIANEVQLTNPELVHTKNGYLAVDYNALREA